MAIAAIEGRGGVIVAGGSASDQRTPAVRVGRWRIAHGALTFEVVGLDAFWSLFASGVFHPAGGLRRSWPVVGDLTSGHVDIASQ